MDDLKKQIVEMRQVYEMFLAEGQEHLNIFAQVISGRPSDSDETISNADLAVLQSRLHLIKGGSGFLKLMQIHALCAEACVRFKQASPADRENLPYLQYVSSELQKEFSILAELLKNS